MAVSLTTGELLTLFSVLVGFGTLAFGVWKYVEGKISGVRSEGRQELAETRAEAAKDIAECRAQHAAEMARLDARLEAARAECAKREDFMLLNATMAAMTTRMDGGMANLNRRMDEVLSLVATTRTKE